MTPEERGWLSDEVRWRLRDLTEAAIAEPLPIDGPNPRWHELYAAYRSNSGPYVMRALLDERDALAAEVERLRGVVARGADRMATTVEVDL